jgi:two-component system chemotaxis response regulator CheB
MRQARDIVVIGGSAGGLEALCQVVSGLPKDFPAALLVVLHTSPQSPGLVARVVARSGQLPVAYGQHGETIMPGRVYIAPAAYHLAVATPGTLLLHQGEKVRFSRPSVDVLFQSAAEVFGPRVIGVILSGGNSDGTDGFRKIEAAGGIAVVQEPIDAKAPQMPMSAVLGDAPDYRVALDQIASLLLRLTEGG